MTSVKTKRKRPTKWKIEVFRAVGEFKDGERRMLRQIFRPKQYRSEKAARRSKGMIWRYPYKPFIYKDKLPKGWKIVELEIFPENGELPGE